VLVGAVRTPNTRGIGLESAVTGRRPAGKQPKTLKGLSHAIADAGGLLWR
jgi:hypothetical protein